MGQLRVGGRTAGARHEKDFRILKFSLELGLMFHFPCGDEKLCGPCLKSAVLASGIVSRTSRFDPRLWREMESSGKIQSRTKAGITPVFDSTGQVWKSGTSCPHILRTA